MPGDDPTVHPDDPDFISEDGVTAPFQPGAGLNLRGMVGSPTPVFVPKDSTPLHEDGPEGAIPPFALWAMKFRRHGHLLSHPDADIRAAFGTEANAVYVMDDGRKHCMVSRKVGTSPDGCTYCLVARIPIDSYYPIADGSAVADDIFANGREFALCSVFEAQQAVSNVIVAQTFAGIDDVPPEYLPPSPALEFSDLLEGPS
jgi:hypothetical protein